MLYAATYINFLLKSFLSSSFNLEKQKGSYIKRAELLSGKCGRKTGIPSPFLGHKERRKSIVSGPYTVLGLVLQLEDILEIVICVYYPASVFTKGFFWHRCQRMSYLDSFCEANHFLNSGVGADLIACFLKSSLVPQVCKDRI